MSTFTCGVPGVGIYYSDNIHGMPPVMLQSVRSLAPQSTQLGAVTVCMPLASATSLPMHRPSCQACMQYMHKSLSKKCPV